MQTYGAINASGGYIVLLPEPYFISDKYVLNYHKMSRSHSHGIYEYFDFQVESQNAESYFVKANRL